MERRTFLQSTAVLGAASFINPTSLFGIQLSDPIVHGTFWSLFFNIGFLILGTLFYDQSGKERNFADFYTEYYKYQDQSNRLV